MDNYRRLQRLNVAIQKLKEQEIHIIDQRMQKLDQIKRLTTLEATNNIQSMQQLVNQSLQLNDLCVTPTKYLNQLSGILGENQEWCVANIDVLQRVVSNFYDKFHNIIDYYYTQERLQRKHYVVQQLYECDMPIFQRVIIDEADSIQLTDGQKICGKINWLISSQYQNINMQEYKISKIHYRNKTILMNNPQFVDQSFDIPEYVNNTIICRGNNTTQYLTGSTCKKIIGAINTGDIQMAVDLAGCDVVEKSCDIIKAIITKTEKQQQNINAELSRYRRMACVEDSQELLLEMNTNIQKLSQQNNRLEICKRHIQDNLADINTRDCPVCLNVVSFASIVPCCNNVFCFGCIQLSIQQIQKCPLCRQSIKSNEIITTGAQNKPHKLEQLKQLLRSDGKFIIFSDYKGSFGEILQHLQQHGIPHRKLQGAENTIINTIRKFSNGDIKVLLLDAANIGAGLNLQMATDIVFYHKLDPSLETHIIGRGQRAGRQQPLVVHRLINQSE